MKHRIGVVGFGAIGQHHARNLSEMEAVSFAGVADSNESTRADAASLGYRTYATLEQLLREGVDAVVLSVPTASHYESARKCIAAGVPVLIEKPIALDSRSGKAIIDFARSKAVPVMVGYVERYNPAVMAIRDFMAEGGLGQLFTISARRVGVMPARIKDANVLIDIGVHDIDLVAFITGRELVLRAAMGGRAKLQDRLDFATLALDAEGIAVDINANWITPVKIRELFVTGENGLCHVDYMTQSARFAAARDLEPVPNFEAVLRHYTAGSFVQLPVTKAEPLRRELEVFVDGLAGAPLPDPEISLVSLRIAEEATRQIDKAIAPKNLRAAPA
jgi:UDP-N-acetylglucosamine 3-dehydrogenase